MNITYLADHREVISTLAQWFYQEWAYLYPDRTLEDVRRLLSKRTNKEKIPLALIAMEEKELLGTVCLKVHDMDTRQDLTPWMAGLYVVTSRRRQGIGTMLVSAIEEKARELGVATLYLYTPESEAFYLQLGWKVKERTGYHGYPVSIMEKDIAF